MPDFCHVLLERRRLSRLVGRLYVVILGIDGMKDTTSECGNRRANLLKYVSRKNKCDDPLLPWDFRIIKVLFETLFLLSETKRDRTKSK